MYFKRLELVGFKSFADKTTLNFDSGVTAVVGPNGCGKSNISDAIRWVLGEQSAKSLRGSSMEDIIFNGSSTKDAVNFAEVSITLSNSSKILEIEYDEVTITRRLYRSGDSEYLINKNTVRLKDIHELLMGTGIGTDHYSVIEQGKMDMILAAKAEERREIFEEAAGITKFKAKKKEALRKLEQTDQNLLRINDIILEVKRQIGSIERQAKKAESYKSEFEKLKQWEMAMAWYEKTHFESRRSEVVRKLASLRIEEQSVLSEMQSLEETLREKQEALRSWDEELSRVRGEELEASATLHKNLDRILLDRERIAELGERREHLLGQMEQARRRLSEMQTEFRRLEREFETIRKEEIEGQEFLSRVEGEFQAIEGAVARLYSDEDTTKLRILDLASDRASAQNAMAKIAAQSELLSIRAARLGEEREALSRQNAQEDENLKACFDDIQRIEESRLRIHQEKSKRESHLTALKLEIEQEEERIHTASIRFSSVESKHSFLSDLVHRFEGFQGGVKALLESRQTGALAANGLIGLLADLLKVEKGFELAVEAAFENHLQAVVFEKDGDVLKALEFLRPLKRGRALLLSAETSSDNLSSPDSQGAASILRFVTVDARVNTVIQSIAGHVFVAENPAAAYELSRRYPANIYVTREGERFEGRMVTGGSSSQEPEATLVGRQARVEELAHELEQLSATIKSSESAHAAAEFCETQLKTEMEEMASEFQNAQIEWSDKKSRLTFIEDTKRGLSDRLSGLEREASAFLLEEEKISIQTRALQERLGYFQEEERTLGDKILSFQNQAREKSKEKEALLVRLAETRSRQNSCTAQREKIEKDKTWVSESKLSEEKALAQHDAETNELVSKKEELEAECAALETENSRTSLRREEAMKRTEEIRRRVDEETVGLKTLEAGKNHKFEFLKTAGDRIHEAELQEAQLGYEMGRLSEKLFNSFQAELTTLESSPEFDEMLKDIDAAKTQIQTLRDKIQKMGPVNLVAIEEYGEMKERWEFLTKQQEDLVTAKNDLHKAILKINRTTRELFIETFAQIQKNFSTYYKELFGGGAAELVLLDEGDVLESGIEIIARPPGKKLQNIMLLSGGEKALTAIALLFSLFKVKPSPFCVLDEIDAPLDESNVDRFCRVLKEFTVGSQFIMITHNKRTMNLADAMYGITMEETGASRIISVKFSDKAEVLV